MRSKTKHRLIICGAALLLNLICTGIVFFFSIETTNLKIIGSFVSIIMVGLAARRFPTRFYLTAFIFLFFASTLGSCLNLYRHIGFYDLFVHFLSGILLADGGYLIINRISTRRNLHIDRYTKTAFACVFSCACAAFWEIYEYTADRLINAQMQGTKENTMNDIIAGVLGAVVYFVVAQIIKVKKSKV